MVSYLAWLVPVVFLSLAPRTLAQDISGDQLQQVVARLAEGANHSWELGTRAQALLELNSPFYSVFSNTPLPPPVSAPSSATPVNLTDVISIAQSTVSKLNDTTSPQPLVVDDGAAGDPASIGVAVLLSNWTRATTPTPTLVTITETLTSSIIKNATTSTATESTATESSSTESSSTATESTTAAPSTTATAPSTAATATATNVNTTVVTTNDTFVTSPPSYVTAAARQLEFLLTTVPRTSDGAISHRVAEVQLWSDFVYMAPPFLAYYGVLTQNKSLVNESYNQIRLYRNYLRDTKANNIWKHIQLGSAGTDDGHWSTGNGWAAAGMLRVLATIKHSNLANQFQSEQTDLKDWVAEILDGMYSYTTQDHLFHNYADNSSTFVDCSSTALVAASTYRLAVLTKTYLNIPNAEKSRKSISNGSHIDANGWLTPVVNPLDWSSSGSQSPEGQAFVVEMQAAWRDWKTAGSPGANDAVRMRDARAGLYAASTGFILALLTFVF